MTHRTIFSGIIPFLSLCLTGCGGGDGSGDRDAASMDAATMDASSLDAATGEDGGEDAASDAGEDATPEGGTPTKPMIFGSTPVLSSDHAETLTIFGQGFTGCTLHLLVGTRDTVLDFTVVSSHTISATVPAIATTHYRGYGTLRLTGCPEGASVPYPIFVTLPLGAWNGPVVTALTPLFGTTSTSVTASGTLTASTRVLLPAGATTLVSGAFTVPAALTTGPLAFSEPAIAGTFLTAPFHTDTNLATSATPSASSSDAAYPATRLIDGSASTGWFANTGNCASSSCANQNVWVELTWPTAQTIGTIALREDATYPQGYDIRTIIVETRATPLGSTDTAQNYFLPTPVTNADIAFDPPLTNVRVLKIVVVTDDSSTTPSSVPSIGELMVFAP